MIRKQIVVMGLVVTFLISGAVTAAAGNWGGNGGQRGPLFFNILEKLDLLETQKTQVADILSSYRSDVENAVENMIESRKKLFEMVGNDSFNATTEASFRLVFKQAALDREEVFILRMEIMSKIKREVLTAEQREALSDMRTGWQTKMKARREMKRSFMDNWLDTYGTGE